MSFLNKFLASCLLTTASLSAMSVSASLGGDLMDLRKSGTDLVNYVNDKAPYNTYVAQAKAKHAVLTFSETAYKTFPNYQVLITGLDIEDPKDSDEYKAVGYKAYPFSIMVHNTSNQPLQFTVGKVSLSLNGKVYPQTTDEELQVLFGKNRSNFWSNTLRTGAALGAVGLSVATTGATSVVSIRDTALKGLNNELIASVGKELDDDNDHSEYTMRKSEIIKPNDYAFLYVYFNEFQVKDLQQGAEFTIELDGKPKTFIFRALSFDDAYDLKYKK